MRLVLVLAVISVAGCAQGIVHSQDAVESSDVTVPADAPGPEASAPSAVDAAVAVEMAPDAGEPLSCEATKTDDACFDCCDAKFPKAIDIWFEAVDACCPNEECTDEEYEACELAADDLCAKDPSCAGLEACEEASGCWEKDSSER